MKINKFFGMTKVVFLFFIGLFVSFSASAQAFGYIDADFILKQMPSYQKAQKEILEAAAKWREDIEKKNNVLQEKRGAYEAEKPLLTSEMIEEKEKELEEEAKRVQDMQQQIFGYEGLYFSRQQELIKPAQEELFNAVQKVARKKSLQFIFTNSQGLTIIYAEPRHDYTEEVLEELGLKEDPENPENKN
jgi:outer membrane protein